MGHRNWCPVCGEPKAKDDGDGFHKTHDYERLEPDTAWCDMCGYHWVEGGFFEDTDASYEDYQDALIEQIRKWQKHGRKVIRRITKMRKEAQCGT